MTLSASPVGVTVTVPSLGAVAVGGVGLESRTLKTLEASNRSVLSSL